MVITGADTRHAVDDDGLGDERTGSCLDGLQRSPGDKKSLWEDQTCGIEMFVAAVGGQIWTSEKEEGPRRGNFGGPPDEVKLVARDR